MLEFSTCKNDDSEKKADMKSKTKFINFMNVNVIDFESCDICVCCNCSISETVNAK